MSGIYIPDMEMPKNCYECQFNDFSASCGNHCSLTGIFTGQCEREENCPLIPVPDHGRLIDADALMKQVEHDTPLSTVYEKTMRRYLNSAPTIIPAEEGET